MRRSTADKGFTLIEVLFVVGLVGVLCAMAVPMTTSSVGAFRVKGDGQALLNAVKLAKMRAATHLSRTRVYADLEANTFRIERLDRAANAWVMEGAIRPLSSGVAFGFGAVAEAPPQTQAPIRFSPQCRTAGTVVGNTACIVFNSRGVPVDDNGDPVGGNALYVTNGSAVYGVTVTAAPLVKLWWIAAGGHEWAAQ